MPLRLRGSAVRSIIFEREGSVWVDCGGELTVFIPLRGIGDDARRMVPLTERGEVTLRVHKDNTVDAAALAGVLGTPRRETWTSVLCPPMVPYEWMDLWLCCRLDNPLVRMNVQADAVERVQLMLMFGWGSMATVRGPDLAYLTVRRAAAAPDGGKLYEVGVMGHGPGGVHLAQHVGQEIVTWNAQYRDGTAHFEIIDRPDVGDPQPGRLLLDRLHHSIVVVWNADHAL